MRPWMPTFFCSLMLHMALALGVLAGHFAAKPVLKPQPISLVLTAGSSSSSHAAATGSRLAMAADLPTAPRPPLQTKQIVPAQRRHKEMQIPSLNKFSHELLPATAASAAVSGTAAGGRLGTTGNGPEGSGGPRLIRDSVAEILYTDDALTASFEGALLVDLAIDEFGDVVAVVLRNPSGLLLDDGVLAAARRAQYQPAMGVDGQPTASRAQLRFNFQLSDLGRKGTGISAAH